MWAALKVIRHRGYSFDDEEHAPGTRCVAATIYDEHAEPLGAISLAGPHRGCPTSGSNSSAPSSRTSPRSSRTGSAGAGRIRIGKRQQS
jgi:DNA-binding IclR family transcriptional regulator